MDGLLDATYERYKKDHLCAMDRLVLSQFAQCIVIRRTPMPLSQDTQAKIDKAISDKQLATAADQGDTQAGQALVQAQAAKDQAHQGSLDAHITALASAHDAIAALMADLGVPPDNPAPPPPVTAKG